PVPPLAARPRRYAVTDVERLVTDPYATYARRVLGLRELAPLGRLPDATDRGELLHAILERFIRESRVQWSDIDAAARLAATAEAVLAETVPWPALRRLWLGRVLRVADWFVAGEKTRRGGAVPLALEVKGCLRLMTPAGEVTLVARADRIDRSLEGGGIVYDYKAGQPPAAPQIARGRHQQLHLQAAILAAGGFAGTPALAPERGAFIGLAGSEQAVETPPEAVATHLDRVAVLIARFLEGAPFIARARPDLAFETGETDHLARRAEWDPTL
ncbi:MAG: PD-(D/E)XK nuclease family protein, partial [Pikeienuella sp.]